MHDTIDFLDVGRSGGKGGYPAFGKTKSVKIMELVGRFNQDSVKFS